MANGSALNTILSALETGRYAYAAKLCNVALNRETEHPIEVRRARARALLALGELTRAEADYRTLGDDARGLGRCLLEQGRASEAASVLAGAADPEDLELLARALLRAQRLEDALDAGHRAYALAPDPSRFRLRLECLAALGRHAEVIDRTQDGAVDVDTCVLLGTSANALGRSREAESAFRRALEMDDTRVDAHCGLAHALLRQGEYREGFFHNEHRQKDGGACFRFGVRPWRGQALHGERLQVRAEQGLGDILQFVRFMPLVRARVPETSLLVPRMLVRLLQSSPDLGLVEPMGPVFGAADHQTLLMSLPHHLGLGSDIGRASVPYLFPERGRVELWRRRLPPGPKVALVWQGNPRYAADGARSMPFRCLEPLIERHRRRVTFVSLQKHFGREQLLTSPASAHVLDPSETLDGAGDAFVDSLAILSACELLVTTDTSMAHLAAAAGVPTFVLLGHVADWRWGVDTSGTPWYPSVRLFRQSRAGDWSSVIATVAAELDLDAHGGSTARHSASKSTARCSMPPQVVGTGAWSTSEGT